MQGDRFGYRAGEFHTVHGGQLEADPHPGAARLDVDGQGHCVLGVEPVDDLVEHGDQRVLVCPSGEIGDYRLYRNGTCGVSETADQAGHGFRNARLARRRPRLDAQVSSMRQGAMSLSRLLGWDAHPLTTPSGCSLTTARHSPAPSAASITAVTSL